MQAVTKKILKMAVKWAPGYPLRAAMLRWAGYAVGSETFIGEDLIIIDELADRGMVRIGDRVAIAPRVTLVASSRPNWSRIGAYLPSKHGPITIEGDAWIGTGVVVMPGITIGEGAVVAANSVVNENVRPYTVVGGLPAGFLRDVPVPWAVRTEGQES